jgi:hypothetical protein
MLARKRGLNYEYVNGQPQTIGSNITLSQYLEPGTYIICIETEQFEKSFNA